MDSPVYRHALIWAALLLNAACSSPPSSGSPSPDLGGALSCVEGSPCEPTGNPCRRAVCRDGACVEEPREGGDCDDGDLCTEGDRCEAGRCVPGPAKRCKASASCRTASCDPDTGLCVEATAPDGSLCTDGDGCTTGEACQDGACVGGAPFLCPLTDCMIANVCDSELSRCVPVIAPDGTTCSDANVCTEGDVCREGDCMPGSPAERAPRCSEGLCFTEVARELGLNFAPNPSFDFEGAGAAVADFDGDGWMDVVLFQERTPPRLYLNKGGDGFRDATDAWGLEVDFQVLLLVQGLGAGDLDGDGDPDLVMVGEGSNLVFFNEGGRFRVDEEAIADAPKWAVGVALADADLDGDLDVLLANYIEPPSSFPFHDPEVNTLFLNDGEGRFRDASEETGLRAEPAGTTYAIAFTDFNQDGVQDIVECNDFGQYVQPNRWLKGSLEDGRLRYEDVAPSLGTDVAFYCMTIGAGDYDRDGDLDYYHTNIGTHALLRDEGARFVDAAASLGVEATNDACFTELKSAGWGAGFRDFDLDGWPDLFATAGWVPSTPMDANPRRSENKLFHRVGVGFVDVAYSSGVASPARSKGVVFLDYDEDGDADILVANMVQEPELYRNDSPRKGRWLTLALRGRLSNRDGFGARVYADFGTFEILGEHQPHGSYASVSEPRLHFGAGPAEAAELRVVWPSGVEQRLRVGTNVKHELVEPVGLIDGLAVDEGTLRVQLRRLRDDALRLIFLGPGGEVLGESPVLGDTVERTIPVGAVRVRLVDPGGGVDERRL